MPEKEHVRMQKSRRILKINSKIQKNIQIDGNYADYLQIKRKWKGLHLKTNNGILLRAKAPWVEKGGKNTKYFLNLEKRNCNTKNIESLINNEGKEINELK